MDMSNKVLEHIAAKYDSVREGVKAVMGGKVLEYEAKTIKREGIEEGIKEGIEEGIKEGIKGTVSILKKVLVKKCVGAIILPVNKYIYLLHYANNNPFQLYTTQ